MACELPVVDAVARLLYDPETRPATLEALEQNAGPVDQALSLATAVALGELLAADSEQGPHTLGVNQFNRVGLLLGRLCADAKTWSSDHLGPAKIYGAAFADGRLAAAWGSETNVVGRALRKPVEALTMEDVHSMACMLACEAAAFNHSPGEATAATGMSQLQWFGLWMGVHPVSKKRTPDDDIIRRLLVLVLEQFKDSDWPPPLVAGGWSLLSSFFTGRPALVPVAMELDIFGIAIAQLHAIGGDGSWVTSSSDTSGSPSMVLTACHNVLKNGYGESERPDLESMVSCGMFDECASAVAFAAASGVEGLADISPTNLYGALKTLVACRDQPGCEARIRSIAQALAFCLDNSLEIFSELGTSTGSTAAQLCCGVFGREEGGSEFTFTSQQVDMLLTYWSQIVRAEGFRAAETPSPDRIMVVDLCVSDLNKQLLLQNANCIPYLVDSLLLDPEHPRADMKAELKAWCQQHHCEALAQLAVHDSSRAALLRDGSVVPALEVVGQNGMTKEAREFAAAALSALSDKRLVMVTEGQKHVMLSYQWDVQRIIKRLNESLIARGYATWFDLTNMKGSTMDAMSDAIEGADVMLYGVSLQYKESANCRLEANYAHQQELEYAHTCTQFTQFSMYGVSLQYKESANVCALLQDIVDSCSGCRYVLQRSMIPLMMQDNYKPQGWLGLIMGTRLWYAMWGAENDDKAAFENRVDTIVHELGDRGKVVLPEAVTPSRETASAMVSTRAPAPAPVRTLAPATTPHGVTTTVGAATARVPATPSLRSEVAPLQSSESVMHQPMSPSPLPSDGMGMVGNFAQVFAFVEQQQRMHMEREAKIEAQQAKRDAQAKADKAELQAKFEAWQEKRDAQVKAETAELERRLKDAIPPAAVDVISDEQLRALQDRLQALHAAKLICEEELFQLEDVIADCIEVLPTADVREQSVEKTMRMLRLMDKLQGDAPLARQLRRKLTQQGRA